MNSVLRGRRAGSGFNADYISDGTEEEFIQRNPVARKTQTPFPGYFFVSRAGFTSGRHHGRCAVPPVQYAFFPEPRTHGSGKKAVEGGSEKNGRFFTAVSAFWTNPG